MEKMVLSEYYNGLENSKKKEFRNKVMEKTGISLPSFYDKRRNGTWNKSEKFIISIILEKQEDEIQFS